ncbi:Rho GTPase-activating protein 26 [Varanus komodoensis]|nr:Rho GTPase-activating protein 26 [Varanus komodoensis]
MGSQGKIRGGRTDSPPDAVGHPIPTAPISMASADYSGISQIGKVHPSQEPGWLEGTLNGKTGLIPENYVEFL